MTKYYSGETYLGVLVGMCPITGLPVLVHNLKYFTPITVTHTIKV